MTKMASKMTKVAAKAGVDIQIYPSSVRVCLTAVGNSTVSSPFSLIANVKSSDDTTWMTFSTPTSSRSAKKEGGWD